MTFLMGFGVGTLVFLAGWLASTAWHAATEKEETCIPLYIGSGTGGKLVADIDLPGEEARILISSVKLFLADMEKKYGFVYVPTPTERALADIGAEGNQNENGAELGEIDWAEIRSQA